MMSRAVLAWSAMLITGAMATSAISVANDLVAPSADQVRPLLVGQSVPSATVKAIDGKAINLKELVTAKPTVLIFYRGGWCPYCNTQLKELKDAAPKLVKLGYHVVAVSADRTEELVKSREKHHLGYTLLSDSSMEAAKAFGIAFKVDDATLGKYKTFGIDLERASGESHHILPVPAVFLLAKDGTILFEYVNPNYKVRLREDILLAAAKSFSEVKGR